MKLRPMADNILLKLPAEEQTTASGIILAAANKEKPAWFEVASAGPDCTGISAGDKVIIGKINVDEEQELAITNGVMSIPTVIFFKDGKEIDRKVGVMPDKAYAAVLDANQ